MGDLVRGDSLCVIPLIIQTWEKGRQGVSISFPPFSTNTISSPLCALNPGPLPKDIFFILP